MTPPVDARSLRHVLSMHTNGSSDPRHKALVQLGTDEPELARALITMESRRNKEGSEADVVKVAKYVTSLMKKNKTAFKEQHHGRTSGSDISEAVDVALESRKWEDAKQALQLAQDAIVNHAHDKIRYGVSASLQRNPMKKKLTRSAVIAQLSAVADVLELSAAAKAKPIKIVWEEQKSPTGGKGLFGSAFVTLRDQYGERSKTLNVRVDGRDPKNVRVDRGSMMGWEAIDGGRGFSTLAKGKAFATKWVQLAVEQGSEMPDVPKALLPISAAATEDGDAYLATVVSKGKTYKIGFFAESPSLAWDHATHATNDAMPGGKVTKVVRNDGMDPADMGEFISAATVSAVPALEWVERVAETKTSGPVLGAETDITFKDKNTDMPKKVSVALRIDARDAKNVRVDQHALTGWEAIDGGKGLSSVAKAKTYAKKWIAAVIEQGTVSPSISAAMISADMVDFDQQPPPAGRVLGKTTSGKAIYEHPGKNSAETEKRYEGWAANDHNEAMRRFNAAYEKTNQPHLGKMSSFHMTAGQRGAQHPLAAKDAKVAYAAFKSYRDGLSASTVSAATLPSPVAEDGGAAFNALYRKLRLAMEAAQKAQDRDAFDAAKKELQALHDHGEKEQEAYFKKSEEDFKAMKEADAKKKEDATKVRKAAKIAFGKLSKAAGAATGAVRGNKEADPALWKKAIDANRAAAGKAKEAGMGDEAATHLALVYALKEKRTSPTREEENKAVEAINAGGEISASSKAGRTR
jgi:hypothetical protein